MKVRYERDAGNLTYGDKTIVAMCLVRNELNGLRALSEKPVYSENEDGGTGVPYMPRKFPVGNWKIVAVIPKENPYEAPEFISTDAHQLVDEWTIGLDSVGNPHYVQKSGRQVEDYGYGAHNSTSPTTLGCIHILRPDDRADLSAAIQACFDRQEEVEIEVV